MDHNYEDVTAYDLDPDDEERLLLAHNECTFIWANKEGWPVGVIMSYVWRRGAFWLTASGQRARISAVRRDPRVCVVVTSTGTSLGTGKAITWKGNCSVLDDRETKDWFYPEFASYLRPDNPTAAKVFQQFLDSPQRVIIEFTPDYKLSFDGALMWQRSPEVARTE